MRNPRTLPAVASAVVIAGAATIFGSGVWALSQQGTQPNQPPRDPSRDPTRDPARNPSQPDRPGLRQPATAAIPKSPFTFRSPQAEAAFGESVRVLLRLEERMEQSHKELTKKLGEARVLPPERQNAAVLDLLQQMLQHHDDMHRYLVQSRGAWTGETMLDEPLPPDRPRPDRRDPLPPPGGGGR